MSLEETDRLMARAAAVLVRPQIPENIGAVARVAANMGLGRLIVVRPVRWNLDKMCMLATRIGRPLILDRMELAADLEGALAGFNLVIGTTSRLGRFRRPTGGPRTALKEAARLLTSNQVALVFGPEKDGLTSPELALCQRLVHIPASQEAAPLKLAQAVMIMAYELRMALLEQDRSPDEPRPRLAPWDDLRGMYSHLEEAFDKIDPDQHYNRRIWMNTLRGLLDRTNLREHEVKFLRGVCRKICWAVDHSGPGQPAGRSELQASPQEALGRRANSRRP
ncbi:MAG: RNA methyltransferase [Deltaproteobacteria bacterium]|nr:RNA methyltransferase [Deltaproteobacteria bacterium]